MPNILLGVCDGEIPVGEDLSWLTNKVGGAAVWPEGVVAPDTACHLCQGPTTLVVQIYCPLEGSPYHRTLYVFACTKKLCWNKQDSWQVYRIMQPVPANNKPAVPSSSDLFDVGWGDDDWGSPSPVEADVSHHMVNPGHHNGSQSNSASSRMHVSDADLTSDTGSCTNQEKMDMDLQKLSVGDGEPHEHCKAEDLPIQTITNSCLKDIVNIPGVAHDEDVSHSACTVDTAAEHVFSFDPWYLSVIEEPCVESLDLHHENKLLSEYSRKTGTDFSEAENKKSAKGEGYETGVAAHGDRLFQKFLKRISRYPSQVIRYSYNGEALPLVAVPSIPRCACSFCGSPMVFELQILPSLISYLTTQKHKESTLEFGTVLIQSCAANCWSDEVNTARKEQILLQEDPDQKLYK